MKELLNKFKKFDPLKGNPIEIPNSKGNYFIVLKANCKLPNSSVKYICEKFKNKEIIYTGISNKSLRSRDYRQHFNGTAGNSTFRKSIGSMFGWEKIPRDKIANGKTKFNEADENKLSEWMKHNLELYFYSNLTPDKHEIELINVFNPPLNLSKNRNIINAEFRSELSRLRRIK